jgi:hypothetical protein
VVDYGALLVTYRSHILRVLYPSEDRIVFAMSLEKIVLPCRPLGPQDLLDGVSCHQDLLDGVS